MSEDAMTNSDKLMVLIHGSGVVRAGQWARRLIINEDLDSGTQIPYIKRAIEVRQLVELKYLFFLLVIIHNSVLSDLLNLYQICMPNLPMFSLFSIFGGNTSFVLRKQLLFTYIEDCYSETAMWFMEQINNPVICWKLTFAIKFPFVILKVFLITVSSTNRSANYYRKLILKGIYACTLI